MKWILFFAMVLALHAHTAQASCESQILSDSLTIESTNSALYSEFSASPSVLFFDKDGFKEHYEIQPGDSFTVNAKTDVLYLGINVPGTNGKPGTSGSHSKLWNLIFAYFQKNKLNQDIIRRGPEGMGAIRFHGNGIIDVSGYNSMGRYDTEASAKYIAGLIKNILPEISPSQMRITGGRLRDLPPIED